MRSSLKRIFPILLVIIVLFSLIWYFTVYDRDFTRDMLIGQARFFESRGYYSLSSWLYNQAYYQSGGTDSVAIELAEQFKASGNYTKAEYTLSNAISHKGSVDLYIALCKTYVEQDKLLDAVTMLDNVADPELKAALEALRPAAPVATPAPGFYTQYSNVTVEASSGKLYISSDGEYPSVKTDLYQNGVTLKSGENTIYAIVIGDNGLVSPRAVFGYTVGGVIEEVTFADSAMDAYIRQMLKLEAGSRILTSDLWNVKNLVLPAEVIDYSDLQFFPYVTSLTIENSSVASLQILSSLSTLTELTIRNTAVSAPDLAVIAGLPNLTRLTLAGCRLSSIDKLSSAGKLTYLDLSENTIKNIAALASMSALEELNLSKNALTSLADLGALDLLKKLDVSYNSLSSVAPVSRCVNLEELNVSQNELTSLSGVESLKKLYRLDAGYNQLLEADVLSGNSALTELILCHNTLLDVSSLSTLTGLQYFDFSYNEVEVLPAWDRQCALVHLIGSHNKLTSVETLFAYPQLNIVVLDNNQITSVDALAACYTLIRVDVTNNPVTDVSKLTNQSIIVYYTPAT